MSAHLIKADARHLPLLDGCAQTCLTSPPYWGLRDYGLGERGIGLERTPDEWVANLVAVFREVRRVLRDDGTLWVNCGDAYCSGTSTPREPTSTEGPNVPASWAGRCQKERIAAVSGLKAKDIIGLPWLLAFALRADGWYLRSEIIWAKPNPMPESIRDRPTRAHEQIFLLSKKQRYYYDAEAVAEPLERPNDAGMLFPKRGRPVDSYNRQDGRAYDAAVLNGKRNARSVWTIATQPRPEAHFATFPDEIARRCILAGSKPGDLVLDPFVGSGTTVEVAVQLGRRGVGTDLGYQDIALRRTAELQPPLLAL